MLTRCEDKQRSPAELFTCARALSSLKMLISLACDGDRMLGLAFGSLHGLKSRRLVSLSVDVVFWVCVWKAIRTVREADTALSTGRKAAPKYNTQPMKNQLREA